MSTPTETATHTPNKFKGQSLKSVSTDELRALADAIRKEVMARDDHARVVENRATVGRCFRFRNNYSCPEKPRDYWWLYARVERLDSGWPTGWSFEVDKDGVTKVSSYQRLHPSLGGWQAITTHQFEAAFKRVLRRVARMKSRHKKAEGK